MAKVIKLICYTVTKVWLVLLNAISTTEIGYSYALVVVVA